MTSILILEELCPYYGFRVNIYIYIKYKVIETPQKILNIINIATLLSIIASILLGSWSRSDKLELGSPSGADNMIQEKFTRETITQVFYALSGGIRAKKDDPNIVLGADFRG